MKNALPLWQRLGLSIVVIAIVSFVAGLLWQWLLGFGMPAYLAGVIGGLAALPVWEFTRRIKRKPDNE